MIKTIKRTPVFLMITAAFVLAFASCKKDQYVPHQYDDPGYGGKDGHSNPIFSTCGAVPDILKVPTGNSFFLQAYARGVQIYQVKRSATDPKVFSWVNIAPSATLYERPDFTKEVILHYAGPTWEFTRGTEKGEKVVAARLQGITQDVTAIQWLLLKTDTALSTPDNKITFVQRICTAGGLAPTRTADEAHLGNLDSIPYTASYLFYTKSSATDKIGDARFDNDKNQGVKN